MSESLGHQAQRVHMPRAQHTEVAVVECRELRFVQPFHDRQDRGVDVSDIQIAVPVAQLRDPLVVRDLGPVRRKIPFGTVVRDRRAVIRGGDPAGMAFAIALSDEQWGLVADLFDPPGRRGAPAVIPRRQMVDAMLFIGRTGIQWRYLPERYGTWTAVWAQWRR